MLCFHRSSIAVLALLLSIVCSSNIGQAAPPIPGTYNPETMTFYETGLPVPIFAESPAPLRSREMYRGTWKFPVVFIHAADVAPIIPVATWSEQLFTIGTYPTGSMRDYYRESSYGMFDIDGTPKGWYQAAQNYAYYHENNYGFGGGAAELAREAAIAAEADGMDWSQFDNDGDGFVDGLVVIHQGIGGEGGSPQSIWSHVSSFETLEFDGVKISRYSIQPELRAGGQMETIGTICHEHGHVLGLPDEYDIDYTSKPTPVGKWCIMAEGSSIGNPYGCKPAHFCSVCKESLGWITPTEITADGVYNISSIQTHQTNSSYKLVVNNDPKEFFLIENRFVDHTLVFDHLPARFLGGLLIYHVDRNLNGSNSGNAAHWFCTIEDAKLSTSGDLADAGFGADLGYTSFDWNTNPSSDGYNLPSNIAVFNVSNRGETMSFSAVLYPTITVNSYTVYPQGNNIFDVEVSLKNIAGKDASSVTGTLTTVNPNVVIDTGTSSFGMITKNGGVNSNQSNRFRYHTTGTDSTIEPFNLVATSGSYTSHNLSLPIPVNPNRILIVDDDATRKGVAQDIEVFYEEALDHIPITYNTWEVLTIGYPSAEIMSLYDLVIWEDGKESTNAPAGSVLTELTDFLDMGGDLLMSSHEFIYSQYKYPLENDHTPMTSGEFCYDYLKMSEAEQDEYFFEATGVPGSILDGMTFTFTDPFSTDSRFLWWPDEYTVYGAAQPIMLAGSHDCDNPALPADSGCTDDLAENLINNGVCAHLYQGEYRLCFMSVPLHGLSTDEGNPNNRQELMRRILTWFGISTTSPGVDIDLNQAMFHGGDALKLTVKSWNPGPPVTADMYILLESYGMYFFWPSWSQTPESQSRNLATGYRNYEIIFEFPWPSGVGAGTNTRFWAAFVDPSAVTLLGNYDFCPISWE